MENQFNLSRYKELLQLDASGNYSLLDPIFYELLSYKVNVQSQIAYNQKEHYFSLIERYLDGIIDLYEFRSNFLEMENQDGQTAKIILNDFQELKSLRLANDLQEFSDLKIKILNLCFEYFEPDFERMSKNEFYNLVNNWYIQFQNPAYENLIYRSFKILTLILGLEILLILS